MDLLRFPERPDWRERFDELGFIYHSFDGGYWNDQAALRLSGREFEALGKACEEIHAMGLDIVERACRQGDFSAWGLDELASSLVEASWARKDPSLYGRFDLTFDAQGVPKIYEYNADTPTSILEAGWAQSNFAAARGAQSACMLESMMPLAFGQLVNAGVQKLAITGISTSAEDTANLIPMVEWARQAGLDARLFPIESLAFDESAKLHGFDGEHFDWIFKLYPWEWLIPENRAAAAMTQTRFCEPAWKLLLSSKAFLAEAWRQHPGHPNLLAAYLEGQEGAGLERGFAKKPFFSREGANVSIVGPEGFLQQEDGVYGAQPKIVQAFCPMPEPEPGMRFTIGGWISAGRFAGCCSRYTDDHIVTNVSSTCACLVE